MEKPSLQQQDILPTEEIINGTLGATFPVYLQFMEAICKPNLNLQPEYYYKDGKAWLCKITHKKKTFEKDIPNNDIFLINLNGLYNFSGFRERNV